MKFKDLRNSLDGVVVISMLFNEEAHVIDVNASELDIFNEADVVNIRAITVNGNYNLATQVVLDGEGIKAKFQSVEELFDIFEEVSIW